MGSPVQKSLNTQSLNSQTKKPVNAAQPKPIFKPVGLSVANKLTMPMRNLNIPVRTLNIPVRTLNASRRPVFKPMPLSAELKKKAIIGLEKPNIMMPITTQPI